MKILLGLAVIATAATSWSDTRPIERAASADSAPIAITTSISCADLVPMNAVSVPAAQNSTSAPARICDPAGGWAMQLPPGWFDRPAPQHGRELMSYDPTGQRNDGRIPPAGGAMLSLQMLPSTVASLPGGYPDPMVSGSHGAVEDQRTDTVGGQQASFYFIRTRSPASAGEPDTKALWYLRSPFFQDRIVQISVVPGDSPQRAAIDALVHSLSFFAPAPISFVPAISKDEVIARITSRAGERFSRIQAKLVLRKEWASAGGYGGLDLWTDPDALTWVVAYTGDGFVMPRLGGIPLKLDATPAPARATPAPCHWGFDVTPADGWWGMSTMGCGPEATWPSWFDALADHSR